MADNNIIGTNDDIKSLWNRIQKNLLRLAEIVQAFKGHNAIVKQMQELEKKLETIKEDLNRDDLDALAMIIENGNLEITTPEQAEKIVDEVEQFTKSYSENMIVPNNIESRDLSDGVFKCLYDTQNMSEEEIVSAMKDFDKDFNKNGFIFKNKDNDDLYFIKYNNNIYKINYESHKQDGKIHLAYHLSKYDINKEENPFDENNNLKDNYYAIDFEEDKLEQTINKKICTAEGYFYAENKQEAIQQLQAEASEKFSKKRLFMSVYSDKEIISDDNRYTSIFDIQNACFKIRNNKSGELLAFYDNLDENSIDVCLFDGAQDLNCNKEEGLHIGGWKKSRDGIIKAHLSTFNGSPEIGAMFRSKECKEYLDSCGINLVNQNKIMGNKNSSLWSKVKEENMGKVEGLKNACIQVIKDLDEEYSVVINQKNKYTFLEVYNDNNDRISFTFTEEGDAQSLNYKGSADEKARFVHNLRTNSSDEQINDFLKDEKFEQLYSIATQAYTNFEKERITKHDKAYEKTRNKNDIWKNHKSKINTEKRLDPIGMETKDKAQGVER